MGSEVCEKRGMAYRSPILLRACSSIVAPLRYALSGASTCFRLNHCDSPYEKFGGLHHSCFENKYFTTITKMLIMLAVVPPTTAKRTLSCKLKFSVKTFPFLYSKDDGAVPKNP